MARKSFDEYHMARIYVKQEYDFLLDILYVVRIHIPDILDLIHTAIEKRGKEKEGRQVVLLL